MKVWNVRGWTVVCVFLSTIAGVPTLADGKSVPVASGGTSGGARAYLSVDLSTGKTSELDAVPNDLADYTTGKLLLRRVPAGTFTMGSPDSEEERDQDEKRHEVVMTKDYLIGVFEVTQGQWELLMGSNPSQLKEAGKSAPVEKVSWDDCQEFIGKLNAKVSGGGFRLPTEAEWERACRAGSTGALSGSESLDEMGWYVQNSDSATHPVGRKKPNAFGLYDMHGNVWEWCADWYGAYPDGKATDPTGAASGSERVHRGGGWYYDASNCRSAYRRARPPGGYRGDAIGFRLVRSSPR